MKQATISFRFGRLGLRRVSQSFNSAPNFTAIDRKTDSDVSAIFSFSEEPQRKREFDHQEIGVHRARHKQNSAFAVEEFESSWEEDDLCVT